MIRFLRGGVLPALAAGVVLLAFLALVSGFVQFEMFAAASMKFGPCERGLPFVFIGILFVFASGIVPNLVIKRLGVRSLFAYLALGLVSGLLAEYCYLFENDIWYAWDFSVPSFWTVFSGVLRQMPSLFLAMTGMEIYALIPPAVGLACAGLYWLIAVKGFARSTQ